MAVVELFTGKRYIGKFQRHTYQNYEKFLWELGVMQPRRKVVMMSTNYFEVEM